MRSITTRRVWLAGAAAGALTAEEGIPQIRLPRKIRVGIIGLEGHYEEITGPLPRLPDVELAAVASSDPHALARFRSIRRYADYREMLDRERLDIAAVCNSNGERAAAVLECLERKINVVAEKPLAIERKDLDRIRKAAAQGGVHLTALLPMRFSPPYLAMKQVVDSGEIGEIAQITGQKSYKLGEREDWYRHRSTYGGTIPWIGIHMLDLMRWTSGREFIETASFQSRVGFPELGEMENVTGSLFRLDNGGVALLHLDYLRPETARTHGDDRLRLAGLKGIVEYQGSTGVMVMSGRGRPRVVERLPQGRSVFIDFLESVYLGKPAGLSAADIFRVNEIVLAARESADREKILKS